MRRVITAAGAAILMILAIPLPFRAAYRSFDEPVHVKKERCQRLCGDHQFTCMGRAQKKKKFERKKVIGICRNRYIDCLNRCEKAAQEQ